MDNKLKALFAISILSGSISQAAYVMYIPTEVKLLGALPDGSIKFVTPNEEPTEPEVPAEPTYKGSVTFSTFSEYTKLVNFKTIILGYNSGDLASNNSELPNRNPYPCNPAITTECVTVNDGYSKGSYTAMYNGPVTDVTYFYNSKNLIPNQIDLKTFRTSYSTLYVEQNGEMISCPKGDEGYKAISSFYDKYDQYSVTFTCPGNIKLPWKNVTFKFN
ncbi:hypothetical protein ACQ9ZH_21030 [Pseudomonas chlororaphis]